MKPLSAVLFDLDGTLLDSAPDLVASLNWVRSSEGLPLLEVTEMSKYASRGALGLLNAGMPPTNPGQLDEWKSLFLTHYAANSFIKSALYPGISDLLHWLDTEKLPWGVVTNKAELLTLPILRASGLDESVSCVVCGDTLKLSKPDPAPVLFACDKLSIDPAEVLFVGDDVRDMQAGLAAGTMLAAIHYGYGSEELEQMPFEGSFRINHVAELTDLLRSKHASGLW